MDLAEKMRLRHQFVNLLEEIKGLVEGEEVEEAQIRCKESILQIVLAMALIILMRTPWMMRQIRIFLPVLGVEELGRVVQLVQEIIIQKEGKGMKNKL